MKDTLVSRSDFKGLHPIFHGAWGYDIDLGMKNWRLQYANDVYTVPSTTGPAFCKDAL